MKKLINILLISYMMLFMSGCSDILDTEPKDLLTDETVWRDPEAIRAFSAKMYDRMQTEDLGWAPHGEAAYLSQATDEAVRSYGWGGTSDGPILPDGGFDIWNETYSAIRAANSFLEKIPTSTVLTEEEKKVYLAETRFIRAFYYFTFVKRYGGVPIITKVQEYNGSNVSELQVKRDTEEAVYEFIKTEIDEIKDDLPEVQTDAKNKFRVTKYGALALKSRAMLYAGSIAKYSFVELNGVIGIPKDKAQYFFSESKKASEEIINSKKYSLYEKYEDPAENYQKLFLEKDMHSEAIFTKAFSSPDKGHSFDFYNAPQSFKVDYGCATNPTLEFVEYFENTDGTTEKLRVNDASGNPILYTNPQDIFIGKDPRLFGSIMTPFSEWQNGHLEIRKGIIDGDKIISASNLTDTYGEGVNSITIIGKDGIMNGGDPTKTGFYIKKFMNATERVPNGRSDTYWMVFRYAEILLNYAEACVELNQDTNKALVQLNLIRKRAGIKELSSLNMEKIRQERKIELVFENHRWWDIRRWRIATELMNATQYHALCPYLIWEEGKNPSEMKYIYKIENAAGNKPTKTFLPKLYYVKIETAEINKNPNLDQNPGY